MKKLFFIFAFYFSLFISHNSLSQWLPLNSGCAVNLNKIQFVNSQTGWAGGFQGLPTQYILIKTTNAGANWVSQIGNFPTGNRILSLCFADVNTGYIAGAEGVYKTTNGGNNYTTLPVVTMGCIDIFFINSLTGWVSTVTGISELYKTTNGGANWTSQLFSSYSNSRYSYLRFVNSNTGWCVNDSIFKTTNGGMNWSRQVLPVIPFHSFLSVYAISPDTAWITGTEGIILSTVNGGTNWILKYLGNSYGVLSSYFLNSNTGYLTTNGSAIYKTTNNGTNWLLQLNDTSTILNSIYFTSKDTGYACGSGGKIYKTINGGTIGIRKINSGVPDRFYLFQNYPNPFNPSTNIKYQIIKNNVVTLKVYDLLSREIATLVNEFQKAGTYETQFSINSIANNRLPSGVYFYKLKSGDFSETKIMLLIK